MRRLLFILPIVLLVAGAAFGVGFYYLHSSDAPAHSVAAVELEDDQKPLEVETNSPLEALDRPELEPEQPRIEPKPEPPAKEVETPKPVAETSGLDALTAELEEALNSADLTDEEKAARIKELKKALEELPLVAAHQITLKGRVLDYAGQPLAGAAVLVSTTVTNDKNRKRSVSKQTVATSDGEGNFEGAYTAKSEAIIEIELYGQSTIAPESEHQKLTVTPGQTYDGLVINMPQGAGISGRVVDNNFNPIAGATVRAKFVGQQELVGGSSRYENVLTDADGRFTILGLRAGAYVVSAAMAGYTGPGAWPTLEVSAGDPTALGSDIILTMQTALRVRLTCAEKQPSGRFTANLYRADGTKIRGSGTTDKDGNGIITNVLEDVVEMEIVMRGYITTGRIAIAPVSGAHTDIGEIALEHNPNEKQYPSRGEGEDKVKETNEKLKSADK
jgi:hypothetical protein